MTMLNLTQGEFTGGVENHLLPTFVYIGVAGLMLKLGK